MGFFKNLCIDQQEDKRIEPNWDGEEDYIIFIVTGFTHDSEGNPIYWNAKAFSSYLEAIKFVQQTKEIREMTDSGNELYGALRSIDPAITPIVRNSGFASYQVESITYEP